MQHEKLIEAMRLVADVAESGAASEDEQRTLAVAKLAIERVAAALQKREMFGEEGRAGR